MVGLKRWYLFSLSGSFTKKNLTGFCFENLDSINKLLNFVAKHSYQTTGDSHLRHLKDLGNTH